MRAIFQEIRATWKLALPMMLGQVGSHAVQVVDLAMIGRVGVTPLAAATFANNVFLLFVLFAFGLASALSIMVSEAHGSGDTARAKEALRIGLLVCGAVSLIGAGALGGLVLGTDWWHLGQPSEVIDAGRSYLIYLAASMVPLLLFSSLKAYCEAINRPWLPLAFLGLSIVFNIILNWIFIFGKLGAPAMGLDGAGLATLLARTFGLLALWSWLGFDPLHRLRWRWKAFFRIDWARKWELLKLGMPIGLQICFEMAAFNSAVFMMGWMPDGAVALAAHSIAINYAGLVFMVPLGLMFSVTIRIGQARGQTDPLKARRIAWGSLIMATGFMAASALCFVAFRHSMPYLFLSGSVGADAPAVIGLASRLLLFAAAFAIFDGIQIVASGALRGYRDVRMPTVITFIVYWLVCLPLGFMLSFRLDGSDRLPAALQSVAGWLPFRGGDLEAYGVWFGLCSGLALAAVCLATRLHFVSGRERQ